MNGFPIGLNFNRLCITFQNLVYTIFDIIIYQSHIFLFLVSFFVKRIALAGNPAEAILLLHFSLSEASSQYQLHG